MKFLHSIGAALCGALFLLSSAGSAGAADVYAKATLAGKAHGPGCSGGFPDIKGECWKCPSGYKHDNILLPPDNPKVCKDDGGRDNKKGNEVGTSIAGICKEGWVSLNNGKCYKCPSGYKHDITKFGDKSGVCYKYLPDKYSKANKVSGNLLCDKGFFDPIDGGTCWTCPANAPKRTVHSVKSAQACVSEACGAEGARPCLITERIPSCNSGLLEDFVHNKCVKVNLQAEVCKAVLGALNAGKLPEGFKPFADLSKSKTGQKSGTNKPQLLEQIAKDIKPFEPLVPEIKRIHGVMTGAQAQVKAMFQPETFCNKTALANKLNSLNLRPSFPKASGHFFMAYNLSFSLGAAVGLTGGYSVVTDYMGNTGAFVSIGPQVITNASLGDSIGVQFFPKVNFSDFEGWGFGIGVSGGPPSKIVGAGADVAFSEKFLFQGFGVSGGIGLGVIPADVNFAATHTWKMF